MNVSAKQFLTIAETAEILRVSNLTIYRHTESGVIPRIKVGSRTLIPSSYIQTLLYSTQVKNVEDVND